MRKVHARTLCALGGLLLLLGMPRRAVAQEEATCIDPAMSARLASCDVTASAPSPDELRLALEEYERSSSAAGAPAAPTGGSASFVGRELTAAEQRLAEVLRRSACATPGHADAPAWRYKRARILYEANHFAEAAVLFGEVARRHADHDVGEYAAQLYLDSLNLLGSRVLPPRPACLAELARQVQPLSERYCGQASGRQAHAQLCETLGRLGCQVLRHRAEAHEAAGRHEEAARTYLEIADGHPECDPMDEVLYNAAVELEAAGRIGSAIFVRLRLFESHPQSALAARGLYVIGIHYHRLADYENAARYYEQFVRLYPGEDGRECVDPGQEPRRCPSAPEMLQEAIFLRLGLGSDHLRQAIGDVEQFQRLYGRRLPRDTSRLVFALGRAYEREERWGDAIAHYERWLRQYRAHALPHHPLMAQVAIGRAHIARGDRRRAREPFETAVRLFRAGVPEAIGNLTDADAGLGEPGDRDTVRAVYLQEARDAVSEALFELAEAKREEADALSAPPYRGPRTPEAIRAWLEDVGSAWLERRLSAVHDAEASYNAIADHEVPRFLIAASAAIGQMYLDAANELRDAFPIPAADVRLAAQIREAIAERTDPLIRLALERLRFCHETSIRLRSVDDATRTCVRLLSELDPAGYPEAGEITAPAHYRDDGAVEPAPVR